MPFKPVVTEVDCVLNVMAHAQKKQISSFGETDESI
jgi:hypothetical protein